MVSAGMSSQAENVFGRRKKLVEITSLKVSESLKIVPTNQVYMMRIKIES